MSLTVNTDSLISGRGMKNWSPLWGVQSSSGQSCCAKSWEIIGPVCPRPNGAPRRSAGSETVVAGRLGSGRDKCAAAGLVPGPRRYATMRSVGGTGETWTDQLSETAERARAAAGGGRTDRARRRSPWRAAVALMVVVALFLSAGVGIGLWLWDAGGRSGGNAGAGGRPPGGNPTAAAPSEPPGSWTSRAGPRRSATRRWCCRTTRTSCAPRRARAGGAGRRVLGRGRGA